MAGRVLLGQEHGPMLTLADDVDDRVVVLPRGAQQAERTKAFGRGVHQHLPALRADSPQHRFAVPQMRERIDQVNLRSVR